MKIMNIFRSKNVERRGNNVERDAEIVRLRVKEYWTYQQLANKFGVSRQRIGQILLQNDAIISREGMLDRLSAYAYKFILEYKKENDGNTPNIHTMAWSCPHMFGYPRAKRSIQYLEETGKIIIDKNNPLMVRVVGAEWIAPQEE